MGLLFFFFFLILTFLVSANFHAFDLRRIHSSRCYAKRGKNVIGGLFGYGVFFYVWERVIGGFEGVSFGIENSGYFFSSFSFFCRCSWCLQSHGMVVGLVKLRASCKGSFPFMVS